MKAKARFSRILAVAIAVFVMFSTFSVFADSLGEGDWIYERISGKNEYYIKSYTGSSDTVTIPALFQSKPVTKINDNAFLNNAVFSHVEVPATITEIGSNAFYGCKTLTKIVIFANVQSIGANAFYGCTGLNTVTMDKTTALKDIPRNCFSGCWNIKTFIVPVGVETIGDRAFFDCISLESIVIPASVETISDNAFKNCSDFTIYGYADTYAQEFASDNKIPFELIETYVKPTEPEVTPIPTTATQPSTSEDVTQPSQEYTDVTEPSQDTTSTDATENVTEDTIPTNPINTEPEDDPFATDAETVPSSQATSAPATEEDPVESSTSTAPSTGGQDKKKYIIGDTDLSGKVTVKDATLIQKYAAGLERLDRIQLFLANCNSVGDVNVKDATQVQKYCAGFLNILFVGQEVEI